MDEPLPTGRRVTRWRVVDGALARPRTLWTLAVLAMALDVALTGVGLSLGLTERNPLALALIDAIGLAAAGVLLKGAVLALGYACWRALPHLFPTAERYRNLLPVGVALPSWFAVGVNATLILSVV